MKTILLMLCFSIVGTVLCLLVGIYLLEHSAMTTIVVFIATIVAAKSSAYVEAWAAMYLTRSKTSVDNSTK
jgi:hypothetical protein